MRRDGATIRHRAGVVLAAAALAAAGWAAIILLAGGVTIRAGGRQIGSRDPVRPLLAAAAVATLAYGLLGSTELLRLVRAAAGGRDRAPARVAAIAAASTLVVSIAWNTRAVGGSDSSCYALQADAFAQGRVTLPPPLPELPPGVPPLALAPTGFVPAPSPPHDAVPICAPGLALAMVPALLIDRSAIFLVVPLFAAMAVWCAFLLGRMVDDDVTGACAAVLLACSPIFLYQSVQPMSDVPATALWLGALVMLPGSPIAAGLCASCAVLMRPNMALVVLPLLLLLRGPGAWLRFAAASLPALAVMAALNAARYGSPLASGYGSTDVLFSLSHVGPNLARYPAWLIDTHSPLIVAAVAAPVILWRRGRARIAAAASTAAGLTVITYLAYTVFDDWWYIRFLLPALPVILVFSVTTWAFAAGWLLRSRRPIVRTATVVAATVTLCAWFVHVASERSVFDLARLESRFRLTGEYAARALPANAIVLAVQESGSLRYYGGRGTLTWDGVPGGALDAVIAWLGAHGYSPVIALEDAEEPRFRARFAGQAAGGIDWPPAAEVHAPTRVRLYDPGDRVRYLAGARIETEHVR